MIRHRQRKKQMISMAHPSPKDSHCTSCHTPPLFFVAQSSSSRDLIDSYISCTSFLSQTRQPSRANTYSFLSCDYVLFHSNVVYHTKLEIPLRLNTPSFYTGNSLLPCPCALLALPATTFNTFAIFGPTTGTPLTNPATTPKNSPNRTNNP